MSAALIAALRRIEKWFGEFPPTNEFWDDEKTRPMSYGAAYGSNGERDYMRGVARAALALAAAEAPTVAQPVRVWCETCDGTGKVYQEHQLGCHIGGDCACPDCDGNGFRVRAAPPQPVSLPSDRQPYGDLRNAKWLDPECYGAGACQSLKFKAQPVPLTDEQQRDLAKECGLDWHRGYMPLFDGDPTNRFSVLIEAVERAHGIGSKT